MKIRITFDLNITERRAISHWVGDTDRPATHDEARQHIIATVYGDLETLCADRENAIRFADAVAKEGSTLDAS